MMRSSCSSEEHEERISVVGLRRPAEALALGSLAFASQPGLPGRGTGPGRHAGALHAERRPEHPAQAFPGQLAVAGLRAGVGNDRAHDGSQPIEQAGTLAGSQRPGGAHIEAQLDSRISRIGVLPSGAAGTRKPPLQLFVGDLDGLRNPQSGHDAGGYRSVDFRPRRH
jgi:hypothetical protein